VLGRVPLLGVDEVRELDGIADEENGRVVANLVTANTHHQSLHDASPTSHLKSISRKRCSRKTRQISEGS
jgi:hypothetical protein